MMMIGPTGRQWHSYSLFPLWFNTSIRHSSDYCDYRVALFFLCSPDQQQITESEWRGGKHVTVTTVAASVKTEQTSALVQSQRQYLDSEACSCQVTEGLGFVRLSKCTKALSQTFWGLYAHLPYVSISAAWGTHPSQFIALCLKKKDGRSY